MKAFHLTIARVGENLFDEDALSVTVPGAGGVFTVLADHEPFVSTLASGTILIKTPEGGDHTFTIEGGGIVEVSYNQATILL